MDSPAAGRPMADVGTFYRAVWAEAQAAVRRWRLDLAVEIAMVVAWFAIRTVAGADGRAYLLWVVAAGVLALIAPRSGLVVFVATSVFFEPDTVARTLAPRELVILPLALGVLVRIAADRFRWRPGPAIWLALLLVLGTALGVLHSFARFEPDVAWHAAQSWIGNMLAPVVLLVAAAWTARDGSLRVLVVAIGVAVVASLVCLVEYAAPGTVSTGPLEWVGFWKTFNGRLAGTIPSPNALSAQLIAPTAVILAAVLLSREVRLRVAALAAAVPLVLAHVLTFSRSPLLGGYFFVVVVAWRVRRVLGIAALAGGLLVAALFLPTYLQIRSQSALEGAVTPGSILVASDVARFQAWGAAVAMWRDEPMVGHGFLSYKALADVYGDPVLGSPHNEWLRLFAEEGSLIGLVGLGFVVVTAATLARGPGWLGTGVFAGFLGYVIAASFNNPLLFVRVSAVAFSVIGVGLALAQRARAPAAAVDPTTDWTTAESGVGPALH